MRDFFKNLSPFINTGQISDLKEYLYLNRIEANKVIANKVASLSFDNKNDTIDSIYTFINLFSNNNEIVQYLLEELLEYYLNNIESIVLDKKWHLLEILMDIINKEDVFKGDKMKFETFVSKSLVLLNQERHISSSEKEIATDMFLEIALNSNKFPQSKFLIIDFFTSNLSSPYQDFMDTNK